jgi:translation initiation factor 2B subunit (eIF-2B alpha/beta/delta family)
MPATGEPRERTPLTIQRDLAEVLKEISSQQHELIETIAVQHKTLIRLEENNAQLIKDRDWLMRLVRDGTDRDLPLSMRIYNLENELRNSTSERKNFWRTLGGVGLALIVAIIGALATIYAARIGGH